MFLSTAAIVQSSRVKRNYWLNNLIHDVSIIHEDLERQSMTSIQTETIDVVGLNKRPLKKFIHIRQHVSQEGLEHLSMASIRTEMINVGTLKNRLKQSAAKWVLLPCITKYYSINITHKKLFLFRLNDVSLRLLIQTR